MRLLVSLMLTIVGTCSAATAGAPGKSQDQRDVSIGCIKKLEQYSSWLAIKYNFLRDYNITDPIIVSTYAESRSEIAVSIFSSHDYKSNIEFKFPVSANGEHVCDNKQPHHFVVNGESYTLQKLENLE